MIPPTSIPITGGKGDPEEVKASKDPHALTIGTATDKESKRPFKEVLGLKEKTRTPKAKQQSTEDDEKLSPLDLAKTLAKPTKTPSIVDTAVFRQEPEEVAPAMPDEGDEGDVAVETASNPPAALSSDKVSTKPSQDASKGKEATADDVAAPTALPSKDKKSGEMEQSTQVIASVQPQVVMAASPLQTEKPAQESTQVRQNLIQMVSKMLETLQQIKSTDRTETTMTLHNMGIFDGTQINITEFNSSKGQFNVTFNFTNTKDAFARQLIEMPLNQQRLQQALLDKGYILQQIRIQEKIPGLSSLETGDVHLAGRQKGDEQAESATDEDAGTTT